MQGQTKPKPKPKTKGGTAAPAANTGTVVLDVGREKFTAQQIADAYQKNSNRGKTFFQLERDSALDFVNLYANYRLKVQAAEDEGLDKKPEVIEDLRNNRMQLAIPSAPATGYLIERKVVDPAVEAIFKRRSEELKVAVIFSSMRPADPADTLRAYQRTLKMYERLKAGVDFARMAADSSDDPNTKASGGVIGYITAGMVLRSLEDAAYETQAGKVYDGIIRVPSGFVLLKVIDRVPRYKVHAAHILIQGNPKDTANVAATSDMYSRLATAQERLKKGEDFATVAREMSDDKVSGANGGDLMSYYTRSLGFEAKNGKLVPEFEDAMFKLAPGEVSGPVVTQYGIHLIKVLDRQMPKFEDEKETIRQMYKSRFLTEDRAAFVRKTIQSQGFQLNSSTFNQMLAAVNQKGTAADSSWAAGLGSGLRSQELYSYDGKSYTLGAWIDSVEKRSELRATPLNAEGVRNSIYFLLEQPALTKAASNLETEYPEFAALMREFRDGILIFKLEEEAIWNKLNKSYDEEKGKAYFQRHQAKYMTQPKIALTEIFIYNEDEAKRLYDQVRKGDVPFDTLAAKNTQRQGYRERGGHWAAATARNADIVKQVLERRPGAKPGDILEPFSYQSGYSIIRVDSVEASHPMTYEEARSEVQGDYLEDLQKDMTKEWLDSLRLKYRVKINERALESMLAAK
jgi:peptidyl-prolyl cis-trans isomerase SurA